MTGVGVLLSGMLRAQYTENDIYNYIDRYHGLAMEKMRSCGIPASITLAQGILASNATPTGRARLISRLMMLLTNVSGNTPNRKTPTMTILTF